MTTINKSAVVPYSTGQMYQLVENISVYPEFLPWCKEARVLSKHDTGVEASLTLHKGGLEKTFTTRNTLVTDTSIEMRLLHGPFSRLHGVWGFQPLGEAGCKVSLHMEFEFSNKLLRMTLGPIFSQIINALVDAFIQRAKDLYGKP